MPSDSSTSLLGPGLWPTAAANAEKKEMPQRPSFSSSITSDRLRESERWFSTQSKAREKTSGSGSRANSPTKQRKSVFKEVGLEDIESTNTSTTSMQPSAPSPVISPKTDQRKKVRRKGETEQEPWYSKLVKPSRPIIRSGGSAPPATFSTFPRVAILAFLIAIVIPGISYRGTGNFNANVPADGVGAGPIGGMEAKERTVMVETRADSPVDICTRWAHQSAIVNGTLYIYGGQAKNTSGQSSDTWNNDFFALDLTESWSISNPSLSGLPQPSGPPAVAEGYLWNSFTSLFLYGGLFSDAPPVNPVPYSTWEYSLLSKSWIEHASPITAAGNNSDPAGVPVQRSAEGAGLSVPELGLSWYFGGHQDLYTTPGWSNQIARVYLKSLLEFTHPGYTNNGVQGLGSGKGASSDGAYRNITQGGIQNDAGFTERADGVLVYVPGWGTSGILLGLAGGTNTTFTEMNVIDIYDIASTSWYKQATSGPSPPIRVDPCAVVFAAPDASSFNIYLYGGQNLQPYGDQIQYADMWILTVPSFTWIQVSLDGQSQPPARAGHTCHAWNGQMVVVGGYVGTEISCDSPGIYIFNASSLQWQNSYAALSGADSQDEQATQDTSGSGLSGSYSYRVPGAVQKVIGGGSSGSATATTPAAGQATDGPIATGRPPTFTITQSGSTIVETAMSTATATATFVVSSSVPNPSSTASAASTPSTNIGVIIAAVIAGILALLAAYLAFCTWLYRRQIALYRNHVAMSQRAALGYAPSPENRMLRSEKPGVPLLGAFGTEIGRQNTHSASGSAPRSSLSGPTAVRHDSNSTGNRIFPSEELTPMEYQGAAGVTGGAAVMAGGLGGTGGWSGGASSDRVSVSSSTEDLLAGHEPSFISVVLSPRRTLRVINRD